MKTIAEYSDPVALRQLMANAKRLGREKEYWEAFSRLCVLSGREDRDSLVREFHSTLTAYEELLSEKNQKKTLASRTRQKLARKGVVQCLEDWASQKTSDGLELLVANGLFHLTAEYLVVKYAERFSTEAVSAAQSKLFQWGCTPN
jgi:hypothetical protein